MSDQNSDPSRPLDSSNRPEVPKYGEYANTYGVPGYAAPPSYGAPAYAPPVRKRRTWDAVLTSILLVLALFGMLAGLTYAGIFASPGLLDETMRSAGFGGFSGSAGAAPAILAISHIVLFLLALGISIPLLIRGRVVVFWIPLVIGVVAAIIFWSVGATVLLSDPGFISHIGTP
jgi:hypothetical protein